MDIKKKENTPIKRLCGRFRSSAKMIQPTAQLNHQRLCNKESKVTNGIRTRHIDQKELGMKHNNRCRALCSTLATASFSAIITDSSNNALYQATKQTVKHDCQQNNHISYHLNQKWYSRQPYSPQRPLNVNNGLVTTGN